ncbi:MAG: hypothetical protein FWB72_05730 [Firmicutes bacterium]|nr:hypothetical protein [Bacillota bacterium]
MSVTIEVQTSNSGKKGESASGSTSKLDAGKAEKTRAGSALFKRIRSIKHIEFIAAGVIGCVILLIFLSSFVPFSRSTSNDAPLNQTSTQNFVRDLENRLTNTLGLIGGAGQVSVMITLDGSSELVLAITNDRQNNTTTTTGGNGASNTVSNTIDRETIIIAGGQPIVIREIYPAIRGVVVVAQGANDIRVRLEIMRAVETLLGVPQNRIQVLSK